MEKRKFTRVPFNVEALVRFSDVIVKGKVENLSMRGMLLRVKEKVNMGELLDITINLTGDTSRLSINLKGTVVRTDRDGVALQFEKMDLDSFVHLKNIMAYNSGGGDKIMEEFIASAKDEE